MRWLLAALIAAAILAGCGSENTSSALDQTPTKLDGQQSHEFEQDDLERAESAPDSVRDYCSGAVSEAQELGCLSHVSPDDLP